MKFLDSILILASISASLVEASHPRRMNNIGPARFERRNHRRDVFVRHGSALIGSTSKSTGTRFTNSKSHQTNSSDGDGSDGSKAKHGHNGGGSSDAMTSSSHAHKTHSHHDAIATSTRAKNVEDAVSTGTTHRSDHGGSSNSSDSSSSDDSSDESTDVSSDDSSGITHGKFKHGGSGDSSHSFDGDSSDSSDGDSSDSSDSNSTDVSTTDSSAAASVSSSASVTDGTTGEATFYTQDGTQGACGLPKISDSALVVALSASTFQANCGKTITITNKLTGQTASGLCNDECPECVDNHVDLSIGFWQALGTAESVGVIPIDFSIS